MDTGLVWRTDFDDSDEIQLGVEDIMAEVDLHMLNDPEVPRRVTEEFYEQLIAELRGRLHDMRRGTVY